MDEIFRQGRREDGRAAVARGGRAWGKALVTGATGFLGAALVAPPPRPRRGRRPLPRADRERPLPPPGARRAAPERRDRDLRGSLATPVSAAAAIEGVGVIYHLAASIAGAPADMFLNTVVTSKHLLEAVVASTAGAPKMVLVSPFGVFGVADPPAGRAHRRVHAPRAAPPRGATSTPKPSSGRRSSSANTPSGSVSRSSCSGPARFTGRGGSRMSVRVGLHLAGIFLDLGGENVLPLTYVDNCAEAIALAGESDAALGQTDNVVDDDLVDLPRSTCAATSAR